MQQSRQKKRQIRIIRQQERLTKQQDLQDRKQRLSITSSLISMDLTTGTIILKHLMIIGGTMVHMDVVM